MPLAASRRADPGGTSAYDDVETADHVAVGDSGRWMSEAPRVAEIALFEPVSATRAYALGCWSVRFGESASGS
jgi:hypothetical protein